MSSISQSRTEAGAHAPPYLLWSPVYSPKQRILVYIRPRLTCRRLRMCLAVVQTRRGNEGSTYEVITVPGAEAGSGLHCSSSHFGLDSEAEIDFGLRVQRVEAH